MYISDFEWDAANVRHIWRHGVDTLEAQEVFINGPVYQKTNSGKYVAFGSTNEGRYLFVVFYLKRKGIVRVVTARDMQDREKRRFRNRRKG